MFESIQFCHLGFEQFRLHELLACGVCPKKTMFKKNNFRKNFKIYSYIFKSRRRIQANLPATVLDFSLSVNMSHVTSG